MTGKEIKETLERQKAFFETGATLPLKFRKVNLKRLYNAIRENEKKLEWALKEDLGKSSFESYMCEISLALKEIKYMLSHMNRFAMPRLTATPMVSQFGFSYVKKVPKGNVLIITPWNYPVLLSLTPLIDAMAAGCTAVIKTSSKSPSSSLILSKILGKLFDTEYVAVINSSGKESSDLIHQKFDHIFFTGSNTIAKEVLKAAAENLTPCTLELGGKSPCIVDKTANIPMTAQRIVWGKFLNAGQTCVAPDYILCQEEAKPFLLEELKKEITRQLGSKPIENPDFCKIINQHHFERIGRLITNEIICFGGKMDASLLKIEPTILDHCTWDDPIMGEEIFGPVLPILTFKSIEEIPKTVNSRNTPLAFYFFSRDRKAQKFLMNRCRFGGGCINDCILHIATSHLPFGGFGESGMGSYHGRAGFDTFSHSKSILDRNDRIEFDIRYQPFGQKKMKLMKKIMK